MKPRFYVLIIGDNKNSECSTAKSMIAETTNGIFDVTLDICVESALQEMEVKAYSIVLIDLDFCDFDQTVYICERARSNDRNTILVVITSNFHDFLFDQRLLDVPIDDFFRKPFVEENFKRRLLMWSIRYRKRVLNSNELDVKMREYQLCLDEMKKLEDNLKEILGRKHNE